MKRLIITKKDKEVEIFTAKRTIVIPLNRQIVEKLRSILLQYLQQGYILLTVRGYFGSLGLDETETVKCLYQEGLAQIS